MLRSGAQRRIGLASPLASARPRADESPRAEAETEPSASTDPLAGAMASSPPSKSPVAAMIVTRPRTAPGAAIPRRAEGTPGLQFGAPGWQSLPARHLPDGGTVPP